MYPKTYPDRDQYALIESLSQCTNFTAEVNHSAEINLTSFEAVFKMHYAELCGFANKYLNDLDSAEEIVQGLFVKLWENREKLSIETSMKSYLFSAARNACLNVLKHQKIKGAYEEHNQREIALNQLDVSDEVQASELEDRIRAGIERMPEGRRKIFVMSRYEGLKYKEIAAQLNISIKTVENQMGSAIKFMRSELSDYLLTLFLIVLLTGA